MIADARVAGRDLDLTADVCVVGTGPGGAAAALELTRAGLTVVVLEEGGDPPPATTELQTRAQRLRERGFLATLDRGVAVLAGRLLGGSFECSGGELWRVPAPILDQWAADTGAAWLASAPMAAAYDDVARALSATDPPPPPASHPLARGAADLDWATAAVPLAARHAGPDPGPTPDGARRSVRHAWLDAASAGGAAVLHHARADRIALEAGAVQGLMGCIVDRGHVEHRVRVRAGALVVAAGPLSTPGILLRSRVPDPHRLVGDHQRLQPTALAVGLFDAPVAAAPGFAVTEFADGLGGAPRGVLLRTADLTPGLLAGLLPWTGDDLERELADAARRLTLAVTVRDRRGGRGVPTTDGGAPSLKIEPAPADRRALRHGLQRAAELLLAAGAREVWTSHAAPVRVTDPSDLGAIRRAHYRSCHLGLLSTSPLGGCPLGPGPRRAVLDPAGRAHHLGGLYVADASALPGAPGVPIGATVAVLGREVARTVAADLGAAGA